MIALRRIDHVCLRVADLDEAVARWSVQFGLTPAGRVDDGRALLRCGYEPYALELVAGGEPGHDHTGWELRREVSLADAAARLDELGIAYEERDGALFLDDADGNGIELRAYRDDDRRPDIARTSAERPGFRPRKLGHVNFLTGSMDEQTAFYTDVLGMKVSDRLGDGGIWFHVNSDHHVMALVNQGAPHFHHLAFDMVDWGMLRVAFDHLAQHGRWLGWGPLRHGLAQNLCGYVRITEEPMFVELYCDMEQLEPDHQPRDWPDDRHSSNTWGPLPPRSYFRFDDEAVRYERESLEMQGHKLPPVPSTDSIQEART